MKKILIDLERLRYPNSGIAHVSRNLFLGLLRLLPHKNIDFSFFGVKETFPHTPKNVTIKVVNWQKWHKFFELFSRNYDLVHIGNQLSYYFQRNYKKSIKIVTLHDLNFLHEEYLSQHKKQKMLNRVNKNLRYADYVVCISHFVKEDFLKNQHLLDLRKFKDVRVIYNGIQFPEDRTYDLGRFSFLKERDFILNIGVLFPKKNQKTIIEMLPSLSEDLVLVASGEKDSYVCDIQRRIKELNIENRVHILKNVTEEEKYALLQRCRSYVHPSVAEGFGIPPIEAMAFGKPVFLSNLTSLPEIGGDWAYYFQSFAPEEMVKVYQQGMQDFQQHQQAYQAKMKNWLTQFDYKTMAKAYLSLYEEVLK